MRKRRKITGLKQNCTFAGAVYHKLSISQLTPQEADELIADITKAIAPILTKHGKRKQYLSVLKLLECEEGHKFWDAETYCVDCNIINRGKTQSEWLRKNRGREDNG